MRNTCASQDSWGLQNIVETWASEVKVAQSCPTLGDPMDCSCPGPSVHGMLQARILEWVAIPFSMGSSQPRDQIQRSPALQADSLPSEPPGKRLRQVSLKTAELSGNMVLWGRAEGERWQTRGVRTACECADTSLPSGLGQDPTLVQFSSVAQLCPTFCDPMNRSTPGLPVHLQLPEFTQTHVHRVSDAIQPSHPLSSPYLRRG